MATTGLPPAVSDPTTSRDGSADGESDGDPAGSGSALDRLLGGPTDEDHPGPGVPDRPGPDPPDVGLDSPTDVDVPAGLRTTFWTQVLLVKVGLLAAALGAMLAGFRGDWRGVVLVVGGLVLVARAFQRARDYEHPSSDEERPSQDTSPPDDERSSSDEG